MTSILIVDDDVNNREIVKMRLTQAGYAISEATNGEEGVTAAQRTPPDLIVLDIMMPKMDGWQVCRLLKADARTKSIPIVMLTARSQEIEEARAANSGADDYLTKPCDPKVLQERIKALLNR